MSSQSSIPVPPVPYFVTVAEASIWDLDGGDGADRKWRLPIFAKLPSDFAMRVAQQYRKTWESSGPTAANIRLLELSEGLTRHNLKLSASDQEIRDKAAAFAKACDKLAMRFSDPERQYTALAKYVLHRGLMPPRVYRHITAQNPELSLESIIAQVGDISESKAISCECTVIGAINRMRCPKWWRRALRRDLGRRIEHKAILYGFVHRFAAKYVSDDTLRRIRQQWRLNEIALESVEMENEEGDILSLTELVERSNANPYIRRSELMVRMAGFERYATVQDDVGLFLTLTCPSRFHARYSLSGDRNPNYDDSTPRLAQAYLRQLWARIRSACKRKDMHPYGIRVAEPHHDGTPHWHLLVFIRPEQKEAFVNLCRKYALQDSPDELGAHDKRFSSTDIDYSKGSATGYIAKYISKNIDGHGMEVDEDGDEITHSSERVRAWASVWGVRQFQFFGGPPVTIWRELRRIPREVYNSDVIEQARKAADASDWQAYMDIMGGAGCRRTAQPVKIATQWSDQESAYGEPMGELVIGVQCGEVTVETRIHAWTAVQKTKTETYEFQIQVKPDVDINLYGADLPIHIAVDEEMDEDLSVPLYVKDKTYTNNDTTSFLYTYNQAQDKKEMPIRREVD